MEIKKQLLILSAFFTVLFSACQKSKLENKGTDLPVIESYLIPGQPILVKLYQQKDLTDTAVYGSPITGINVYLSAGSQKLLLTETAKGNYTYADQSILASGKTYTLQFDYNGYAVSATTTMPRKPSNFASQYVGVNLPSSSGPGNASNTVLNVFTWSNPDSLNHVLAFKIVSGAFPVNSFDSSRPVNSQINTDRKSQYDVTGREFPYFGHYNAILFSVNQDYINLLDNNTRTSSQNLTQIPTNIINGFGIFTAMQTDTLSFSVQ
ncbi:DUF4249 family protein [Mucilaginibacter sp. UR6-11]|uniref:DUF4249 family protein n=1 Tax=Mucilaginibacter sp. UR6-11 TaxID=1435644 RepID=UPI001E510BBB|nr:DUF4249 family protein [Mucilaginibacter sp. UR6-11]MCC8426345.1 DUF4249 domain-containing protein [Mucilaginibacter sp. UR6-11]